MTEPGPDVSARLAWPDDVVAIARIQAAAWRERFGDLAASIDTGEVAGRWASVIASPKDARMRVLVALERADVRGAALVHPAYDPDADQVADGELAELVVDPSHRGAGHGSRLVQAAVDTLRADGFTRAVWWIDSTDDDLRRFAVDGGWAPDGAHRELESDDGQRVKQVRLHTSLS